jgi:hypothetical protein
MMTMMEAIQTRLDQLEGSATPVSSEASNKILVSPEVKPGQLHLPTTKIRKHL